MELIKDELAEIRNRYGDERKTQIEEYFGEIDLEDLIEEEESVFTLTHFGYIKRIPASTYRSQRRGGRGIAGLSTREEDFVNTIFTASTHDTILFFSNKGRMYKLKGYQIPEAGRHAKGTAIINLLQLEDGEKVTASIAIRSYEDGQSLIMATKCGTVKKTLLTEYRSTRKGGLNAIGINDDDELIGVKLVSEGDSIMLSTNNGMAIKFDESDVRPMGRTAHGVRGIRLRKGDYVIGMSVTNEGDELLAVTENGVGKKTNLSEYKIQKRGGMGMRTYRISEQTGAVVGINIVKDEDDLMLITSEGVIIRMSAAGIRSIGRATKGVRLMKLEDGIKVASLAITNHEEEPAEDSADGQEETVEE